MRLSAGAKASLLRTLLDEVDPNNRVRVAVEAASSPEAEPAPASKTEQRRIQRIREDLDLVDCGRPYLPSETLSVLMVNGYVDPTAGTPYERARGLEYSLASFADFLR